MMLEIACLERRCSCHSHNGFLTRLGYALAETRSMCEVDRVGSVSGPFEFETDEDHEYDPTHIELNVEPGVQLSFML